MRQERQHRGVGDIVTQQPRLEIGEGALNVGRERVGGSDRAAPG